MKSSAEDRVQDLLDRFCVEAAVQDPFARLSVQSVCGSPQRRSLQKSHSSHLATTREIRHAQSDEKVARVISK